MVRMTADERLLKHTSNPFDKKEKTKDKSFDYKIAIMEIQANLKLMQQGYDNNLSDIKEKVEKIDKTLHGNGRPGLCDKVEDHGNRLTAQEAKSESGNTWLTQTLTAVGIIVAAIIGVLF